MPDRLISALAALTTPAADDYLPIVDVSEGAAASKNKRITVEELFRSIPNGTAAAPSISFEGDPNTGFYLPGADTLAFVEGGVEAFRLTSTGRLGINTQVPGELLEINNPAADTGIWIRSRGANNRKAHIFFLTLNSGGGSTGGTIFHDGNGLAFSNITNTTAEIFRIDSGGRFLVGTNVARTGTFFGTPRLQLEGDNNDRSAFSITNTTDGVAARAANIRFARIRGTVNPVAAGDTLGEMGFWGYDGTNLQNGALIEAVVENGVGASSMPTRLAFHTTVSGATTITERFRITNDGVIAHDQPAPTAVNATETLTIDKLKTGIITSTSAAATDMTLPTGTDTEAGFSAVYTNFTFEWSVINTGPSLVRVLANTTTHLVVGSGSVATGTSGRFATRRTAANTFTTYRLA
jgi:hypothetical protein